MFTGWYADVLQVMYLQREELTRETVYLMHASSIHGVEDMSTLAELHEAAIMHNLFLRYTKDSIYVSVCMYKIALVAKNCKEAGAFLLLLSSESREIGPNLPGLSGVLCYMKQYLEKNQSPDVQNEE